MFDTIEKLEKLVEEISSIDFALVDNSHFGRYYMSDVIEKSGRCRNFRGKSIESMIDTLYHQYCE